MTSQHLTAFTRQRISRLAEAALQRADISGIVPTPIEAVQRAVGIRERIDLADLPPELKAMKPAAWKRVLGAIWFKERTIVIDTSEPEARRLFTDAHETAHMFCSWHEAVLRLDTEETLFRDMQDQIEAEANYGASCLIFQGQRLHQQAQREQISIRTPLALAEIFGASRHSTLHYYVEEHPEALALLVTGRYPNGEGVLPIWRSVESPSFFKRFGRVEAHLPGGHISITDEAANPLVGLLTPARLAVDPPSTSVVLHTAKGHARTPFVAEAYFNGRCYFILLVERRARHAGKRARLAV